MKKLLAILLLAPALAIAQFGTNTGGYPSRPNFNRVGIQTPASGLWESDCSILNSTGTVGGTTNGDLYLASSGNCGIGLGLAFNAYYNAGWLYNSSTLYPLDLVLGSNNFALYYAPMGTTGTSITFSTAMQFQPSTGQWLFNDPTAPTAGVYDVATVQTGTWTATVGGVSGTVTTPCNWSREGKLASFTCTSSGGTSNANSLTLSGLPSTIQPSALHTVQIADGQCEDNGSSLAIPSAGCSVVIQASSTIQLSKNGSATGWTSSGAKGFYNTLSVVYPLN